MNANDVTLVAIIQKANAGADFPDLSGINLAQVEDRTVEQLTIYGTESHRIKTYLAILLMRTMRDFTDTDTGVYKSHDSVEAIVELCKNEKDLRKRIRKQIRTVMESPNWQYQARIKDRGTCIYCGQSVRNDGEGFEWREHLRSHKGSLPVESNQGLPFSSAHISVARGHLLRCLCGLVRLESWEGHRSYFKKEMAADDFQRLETEIFRKGNALDFCRNFSWDFDILRGKANVSYDGLALP